MLRVYSTCVGMDMHLDMHLPGGSYSPEPGCTLFILGSPIPAGMHVDCLNADISGQTHLPLS